MKTSCLTFDEAFEVVREYEHGLSDFDRESGRYTFTHNPELQRQAINSPAAIMQLWEPKYAEKKAQIEEAIKYGALKAYGFQTSPFHRDTPEEIRYRSFVNLEINPATSTASNDAISWEGIYFTVPAIAIKTKARGSRKTEPEILEIYEQIIRPEINNYSSLTAVRKAVQEVAKSRYGALYHHAYHPKGHRGFGKDTIENALRAIFKKDKL